jgi:hypothetical protein
VKRLAVSAMLFGAGLLAASLWWRFAPDLSALRGPDPDAVIEASAVDELSARVEILAEDVAIFAERFERIAARLRALEDGEPPPPPPPETSTFGGLDEMMLLADRRDMNRGLTLIPSGRLEALFGQPAPALSDQCAEPTSPRLLSALEMRQVGQFRLRMARPALDSLQRVLDAVARDHPELHRRLRSYGAFCARLIRGSAVAVSRHAYGLAVDLSIGGALDAMGDGQTQFGLIVLADYFQAEGWIWGAAFGREDSMHFEPSAELLERWVSEGLL